MILQLNPPLPQITPKGKGLCHFIINDGPESHVTWGILLDKSGEWWWYKNPLVRGQRNITEGREYISPFYEPSDVAFKSENDE